MLSLVIKQRRYKMAYHDNPARFDGSQRALTEDELRQYAPSVFATTAHHSRSQRFAPIATIDVVRGLKREGFEVVGATQSVVRIDDRRNFTKHLLRLRQIEAKQVGDTVNEMWLKNADDGTAAYDLMSALYRVQCLNSMVALLRELGQCKVRHTGNVVDKVIEGTFHVIDESKRMLAAPQAWSGIQLDDGEKNAFAEAAHVLRFPVKQGEERKTGIEPAQLLAPRRFEDRRSDLWTTFNVVQENTIRGGLEGRRIDAQGNLRRSSTRGIKGVDQSTNLNYALFVLANSLAEAKGVKIAA